MAILKKSKIQKEESRQAYTEKVTALFKQYSKILLINADNIRSSQINDCRRLLRDKAIIVFGKNTIIRHIINHELHDDAHLHKLLPHLHHNVGLVFTDCDNKTVLEAFSKTRRRSTAKQGALAPCDVVVEPMLTQMGPDQHEFFAALGITTKINKGKIEITQPIDLIKKGDIVNASQASLLQKLEIAPFFYQIEVNCVYDNGEIFDASILSIDDEQMAKYWGEGLNYFCSAALGLNYPCLPAVPHLFNDAAKSILGAGVELDCTHISAIKRIADILANPSLFAAAAPVAAASEEKAPVAAEESEEEAIVGAGGLFGGDSSDDDSDEDSD